MNASKVLKDLSSVRRAPCHCLVIFKSFEGQISSGILGFMWWCVFRPCPKLLALLGQNTLAFAKSHMTSVIVNSSEVLDVCYSQTYSIDCHKMCLPSVCLHIRKIQFFWNKQTGLNWRLSSFYLNFSCLELVYFRYEMNSLIHAWNCNHSDI